MRGKGQEAARAVGSHATHRRPDGVVVTTLRGRISVEVLESFGDAYTAIGGPYWLIDAREMVTYDAAAVPAASSAFARWSKGGLRRVVLVTPSASIRMAAISIRLGVKLATGVTIDVVDDRESGEREIARSLRAGE